MGIDPDTTAALCAPTWRDDEYLGGLEPGCRVHNSGAFASG